MEDGLTCNTIAIGAGDTDWGTEVIAVTVAVGIGVENPCRAKLRIEAVLAHPAVANLVVPLGCGFAVPDGIVVIVLFLLLTVVGDSVKCDCIGLTAGDSKMANRKAQFVGCVRGPTEVACIGGAVELAVWYVVARVNAGEGGERSN